MSPVEIVHAKFEMLRSVLDERQQHYRADDRRRPILELQTKPRRCLSYWGSQRRAAAAPATFCVLPGAPRGLYEASLSRPSQHSSNGCAGPSLRPHMSARTATGLMIAVVHSYSCKPGRVGAAHTGKVSERGHARCLLARFAGLAGPGRRLVAPARPGNSP